MENQIPLDPEQLYTEAMVHFRAARWEQALTLCIKLREISGDYPELSALIDDIRLKQELERVQSPSASPPPKKPRGRRLFAWTGGALALALILGGALAILLSIDTSVALETPVRQALIGTLPTPAPTVTPTPVPAGALHVSLADGETLTHDVGNLYIILDASGSMLARLNGERKINIAHQALDDLVWNLPDTTNVALRTYGRQRSDDCSDVELVQPLAPLDREALIAQINSIVPVNESRTPIDLSLRQAPIDLVDPQAETLIVLLSDGEENCDGDPAAVAAQLHTDYPNMRISVIGFATDEPLREQLAAIATNGGGEFFTADDAAQLLDALQQAITPTYHVVDADGAEIYTAELGDTREAPAGRYSIVIDSNPPLVANDVEINSNELTIIEVREDNGSLDANIRVETITP